MTTLAVIEESEYSGKKFDQLAHSLMVIEIAEAATEHDDYDSADEMLMVNMYIKNTNNFIRPVSASKHIMNIIDRAPMIEAKLAVVVGFGVVQNRW